MRCLGKLAPRHDERIPHLMGVARTVALPPVPAAVDWSAGLTFGPMGNDRLGDCTAAAFGHAVQTWTSKAQAPILLTDDQVVALYAATSGYRPGHPETDQGAVCADVLAHLSAHGVWQGEQRLEILSGHARLTPTNTLEVRGAVAWLGGVYAGLALPLATQDMGDTWDVPPQGSAGAGPDSWGGHCVWVCGADPDGLTCISWGERVRMTWRFWATYADEAWGLVSRDWLDATGHCPDGLDFDALLARAGEIAG